MKKPILYLCLLFAAPFALLLPAQAVDLFVDVYVATDGNDAHAGDIDTPLATLTGARNRLRSARATPGVDRFRGRVFIRGGRYPHTATCSLTSQDSGTAQDPTLFTAYEDEQVIIDGAAAIDPTLFSRVSDATSLAKLNPAASNQVYAAVITSPTLISLLEDTDRQLSIDDRMMHVARFPNVGFSYVDWHDASGETLRAQGTPTNPEGALVHLGDSFAGDWQAELGRIQKARMIGYVSADWLKETLRIHSVDASDNIRLMDGTSYGFGTTPSGVERPYVDHLLCELDEPGEWYFDDQEDKLYLWPRGTLSGATVIGAWAGPEVFNIDGANHVHIERITMQHLTGVANGDGAVDIRSGSNNRVAGCTFRNIHQPILAFNIWNGTENGIRSCEIIDVNNCSRLYGGSATASDITPGSNYIENCHFRQVESKSMYGKVTALGGAGNLFRHNLMHNHNGQTVTVSGPDHVVEFNEVFNTGIEEGDGGSFYSGARADSLGNLFRHNFWHHIICIPSLYRRAAIFSDDGDLGEVVVENVFFKAADAFKTNVGAAHEGYGNVFLDGARGIYVINGSPTSMYNSNMNYLDNDPESGDKGNLLGRGMKSFGISGWETTVDSGNWNAHISAFWRARYPRFDTVMNNWWNQGSARKYNGFWDNVFYSNDSNVSAPSETSVSGSTYLSDLDDFENPATLNFKYKEPRPSWAADIPFDQIGLYEDTFRTTVPDPDLYRGLVAKHWENTTSAGSGGYHPATINNRIYFNTGLLLEGLMTPPWEPAPKAAEILVDAHGAWNTERTRPDGLWEYGYYDGDPSNFVACTHQDTGDAWIGGDATVWQRGAGQYPRIGQYSMVPDATYPAVKRWTSRHDGRLTITVDARQIQAGGSGQTLRLRLNGVVVETLPLTGPTPHRAAQRALDINHGDTIDIELDALGDRSGDWTAVGVWMDNLTTTDTNRLMYLPLDEGTDWPSGDGGTSYDRRRAAADRSGNDHHAALKNMTGDFEWVPGRYGRALQFSGRDEYAETVTSGAGDGAAELTVAVWFRPIKKRDNVAMISSTGSDYFALLLSGYGAGHPVEFRARGNGVVGPDQSGQVGEWTHAVGVWKSGERQELYLNGRLAASDDTPPGGTVDLDTWILGSDRLISGRYYEGAVDEVTIWDRALSGSEVYIMSRVGPGGYTTIQWPGDYDNDGLPDDWEIKYFDSIYVTAGQPQQDQDGDQMSDREEFFAGTHPVDPRSHHQLFNLQSNDPGVMSFQWIGVYGKDYRLESSPDLTGDLTGTWTQERQVPAVSPLTSCSVTSSVPEAFYRVNIVE